MYHVPYTMYHIYPHDIVLSRSGKKDTIVLFALTVGIVGIVVAGTGPVEGVCAPCVNRSLRESVAQAQAQAHVRLSLSLSIADPAGWQPQSGVGN